jgi:hypothetical protein
LLAWADANKSSGLAQAVSMAVADCPLPTTDTFSLLKNEGKQVVKELH